MHILKKVIDDKHFEIKYYFCGFNFYTKYLHWDLYVQYRKFQDAARLGYKLLCFSDIKACKKATGKLRERQLSNISVLEKFDTFAKENDITYWLSCGTMLGAYRHKGFVPWDHDIDLSMFRDDYLSKKDLIKNFFEENSNYKYRWHPHQNSFTEQFANADFTEGIDFFLVEKVNTDLSCKNVTDLVRKARTVVSEFDAKNQFTEKNSDSLVEQITNEHIKKVARTQLEDKKNEREVIFYLPSYTLASLELAFEKDDMFPLAEAEFEGHSYKVPRNIRKILTMHYPQIDEYPPLMSDYEELNDRSYNSTKYPSGVNIFYSTDIDTRYQVK